MMKGLIELDEYLDLSDLDSVNKEFEEVIGSLRDYWRMFYSDTRETDEDGNLLKDNPNVHMISLSKLDEDLVNDNWDRYFLLDNSKYWINDTNITEKLPNLTKMISKLPFENTARIFAVFTRNQLRFSKRPILTKNGNEIANHRDHPYDKWRHEMIWIRFSNAKKIFIMENNKPNYIKGNSCWFDSRKIHGTETNGYGVSLRVDGEFTSEFRDKLFGQGSKWMTLNEKDYDNYRKVWH